MNLDWLRENETPIYYFGVLFILSSIVTVFAMSANNSLVRTGDLGFVLLTGLNLPELQPGNYEYSVNLTNPYDNRTLDIYTIYYCDPSNFKEYVTCSFSVSNGTDIEPLETLVLHLSVNIAEHNFVGHEVYVRTYYLEIQK